MLSLPLAGASPPTRIKSETAQPAAGGFNLPAPPVLQGQKPVPKVHELGFLPAPVPGGFDTRFSPLNPSPNLVRIITGDSPQVILLTLGLGL